MSGDGKKSASNALSKWPSVPDSHLDAWKKAAQKSAPNGDEDQLGWQTPDGIHLKALYTAEDIEGLQYTHSLPGFEPFVRGPQATMYSVRPWTIRQYAGFSTATVSAATDFGLAALEARAFSNSGSLTGLRTTSLRRLSLPDLSRR